MINGKFHYNIDSGYIRAAGYQSVFLRVTSIENIKFMLHIYEWASLF